MPTPRARKPARKNKKKVEAKKPAAVRKTAPRKAVVRKNAPQRSAARRAAKIAKITDAVLASVPAERPLASQVVAAVAPQESPKIPVAPRRMPWRALAAFFAFTLAMSAVGGFIINTVDAATFQGPSQAPPGGNIPITIWNRVAATATQTNAAIEIDGGGPGGTNPVGVTVGTNLLNLGSAAGGQNVVYGVADYAGMNATDYLLLLQTAAAGPVYTRRFSVDRNGLLFAASSITTTSGSITTSSGAITTTSGNLTAGGMTTLGAATRVLTGVQNLVYGNVDTTSAATAALILMQNESVDRFRVDVAGNVTAAGTMKSVSCFGKTFAGITASVWPGNVGSYYAADNRCNTDFPGSHVCRVEELVESIQCSIAGDPIRTNEGNVAWVNGGPPGDPAINANDCIGWTSNAANAYGRVWIFNNTTGGRGTLTGCNVGGGGLKFACCR